MLKVLVPLGILWLCTHSEAYGQGQFANGPRVLSVQSPPQVVIQVLVRQKYVNDGYEDLLSRPQYCLADNEAAYLDVGSEPGLVGGNFKTGYVYSRLAIYVQMTARLMPAGRVQLIVNQRVKANSPERISVDKDAANGLDNILTAEDGQTVSTKGVKVAEHIIDERKIPFLGDLPSVGDIFRIRTRHVSHSDVYVELTPHIVHSNADAERVSKQELVRTDRLIAPLVGP